MNLENQWVATEELLERQADSLGELLAQLRGRISPVLIGDPEWERLLERAHPMPATMAAFPFGFELPLHERQARADFGVSVIGGSRTAAFFEDTARSVEADLSVARIAWLLKETETDDSPLRRVAGRKMLLEYDIDSTGRGRHPDPGIFLYPDELTLVGDRSRQRLRDLGVVIDAIAAATGRDVDAAKRRQVEKVYLAMEPDSSIWGIGAFPARGSGLRLAITGFRSTGSVMAFLERTGWPGLHSSLAATVLRFEERGAFASLGVHFDMQADGVGPTLGLSFYTRKEQWLKDIRHWTPLIDGIGEDRLAVPEKLAALADSWSGSETLFGRSGPFVLVRGIHHIKFTVIGDRIEQVKAYVFLLILGSLFSGGDSAA